MPNLWERNTPLKQFLIWSYYSDKVLAISTTIIMMFTHHKHSSASSVVKGIAAAELYDHSTRLRKKNIPNTIPGKKNAVVKTLLFQRSPPIVL